MLTAIETFSFDTYPNESHQRRTRVKNFFINLPLRFLNFSLSTTFILLPKIFRFSNSRHKFEQFVIIVSIDKLIFLHPFKIITFGLYPSHLYILFIQRSNYILSRNEHQCFPSYISFKRVIMALIASPPLSEGNCHNITPPYQ